jgi:hypothetical protein
MRLPMLWRGIGSRSYWCLTNADATTQQLNYDRYAHAFNSLKRCLHGTLFAALPDTDIQRSIVVCEQHQRDW